GNALFIERWLGPAGETGGTESMPRSLEALLASRLDRLAVGELAVLQRAAVQGRAFSRGAVAHLLSVEEAGAVRAHLQALTEKGLVRQSPTERGLLFRHVLIRDAAYGTLPKAVRAELHERLALWLE